MPENLPIDLYLDKNEDDLPSIPAPESDEEVKIEPGETNAERVKLKLQKK